MRRLLNKYIPIALLMVFMVVPGVRAEQPIFDEMPRWTGGWGVQLMQEFLMREGEDSEVGSLVQSEKEHIHLTHIQGVYTWDKSVRVTVKIPVVVFAEKTLNMAGEPTTSLQDQGLGDPTIALPLKSYFNLDGRSGSWTLAPQLRVPAGQTDEYDVYSRRWATGLSGGYSTETHLFFLMTSAGAWYEVDDTPWEANAGLALGLNFQFAEMNGHLLLKQYGKYRQKDAITYAIGPTVYLRITDEFHAQLQTRHDAVSWYQDGKNRREDSFRIGIAIVY